MSQPIKFLALYVYYLQRPKCTSLVDLRGVDKDEWSLVIRIESGTLRQNYLHLIALSPQEYLFLRQDTCRESRHNGPQLVSS